MANEEYYTPLTQTEYEEGREQRLYPEDIEPEVSYNLRHTTDPSHNVGFYALEMLVVVIEIRPIDDKFVIDAIMLDKDGRKPKEMDTLFTEDGFVIDEKLPLVEGYFSDALNGLDLSPSGTRDRVLVPAG